jgi:hypothetical protein
MLRHKLTPDLRILSYPAGITLLFSIPSPVKRLAGSYLQGR